MSPSLGSVNGHVKTLLERAEAAGIGIEPSPSRFSDKLLSYIDVTPEHTPTARQIIGALERTLNRSHDDARLVLSLCLSLQEFWRWAVTAWDIARVPAVRAVFPGGDS